MLKGEYSNIVIGIYCIETGRTRDLKVSNYKDANHLENNAFHWAKGGYDIADVDNAPDGIHQEICNKNYSVLY